MHLMNKHWPLWCAFLVLIAGNFLQGLTYLNHDVAWVLYSSGRLLDGGVFGEDIVAANPPLIWWLSTIPEAFSRITGMDSIHTLRLAIFAISVVVLLDFHKHLATYFPPAPTAIILIFFSIFISIASDRNFGQREHIAALFILPYLLRTVRVVENGTGRTHWFAAIFAGLGVAFKPHFVFIPLLVELYIILRRRSFIHLFRADVLISTATIVIYLCTVFIWARPYISTVVPAISEVYWGFSSSPLLVAIKIKTEILLLYLTFILVYVNRFPPLSSLFLLTSIGFLGAALLQAKGYSYHIYPITLFSLISLMCLPLAKSRMLAVITISLLCAALYTELKSSYGSVVNRTSLGPTGIRIQNVVDVVKDKVPADEQFLAFSTHPFPGFPVTNYSNRDWASVSNSRIFLPAIVRLRMSGETTSTSEILKSAEARERRAALLDLKNLPTVVFIDVAQRRHAVNNIEFDFLEFYLEAPEFRAIWDNYEEFENGLSRFRTFILKGEKING